MRLWILGLAGVALWAQQLRDKEAALGEQLAKEVLSRTSLVDRFAVRDYVDRLGQKLAVHFPDTVIYKFSVVADQSGGRTHEPIALPGGYVFVGVDLISAAQDEAEFAGMLAHAMAHSVAPIAARGVVNSGSIPLIIVGGWTGSNDYAVPLPFAKLQRAAELAADRVAVPAMANAGYDPDALVRYLGRAQTGDRAVRIAALQQAISRLPSRAYSMSEDFLRIQDAMRASEPARVRRVPTLLRPGEQP